MGKYLGRSPGVWHSSGCPSAIPAVPSHCWFHVWGTAQLSVPPPGGSAVGFAERCCRDLPNTAQIDSSVPFEVPSRNKSVTAKNATGSLYLKRDVTQICSAFQAPNRSALCCRKESAYERKRVFGNDLLQKASHIYNNFVRLV